MSQDLNGLRLWLDQQDWVDNLATLGFGNHRKYRSKQPEGLFRVVRSLVDVMQANGGSPSRALTVEQLGPEPGFDLLYWRLREVWHFGRTAAFDTLCLMRDMDLLRIRPGSCYPRGSTGPKDGAQQLWRGSLIKGRSRGLRSLLFEFKKRTCVLLLSQENA